MSDFVEVYALDCACFEDPALFELFYARQPAWRKQKIDAIRFAKDKRLSLGVGALLQKALPGVDLNAVVFGENGKPYLKDPDVFFNLSHAGQYALCAVGPGELGCDIELIRPARAGVAQRFFHPAELAFIEAAPDETEKERRFFRLWTLKESFIKATGKGLSQPLNSFCVALTREGPALRGMEERFSFKEYDAPPGCVCAVCASAGSRFADRIEYIDPYKAEM
mgnify:CR=1 FL=1